MGTFWSDSISEYCIGEKNRQRAIDATKKKRRIMKKYIKFLEEFNYTVDGKRDPETGKLYRECLNLEFDSCSGRYIITHKIILGSEDYCNERIVRSWRE